MSSCAQRAGHRQPVLLRDQPELLAHLAVPRLAGLLSGGTGQEQAPPGPGGQPSGRGPGWGGGPPWLSGVRRPVGLAPETVRAHLPLLVTLAVVVSIGAVAHGHFVPLLWVGVALWRFRPGPAGARVPPGVRSVTRHRPRGPDSERPVLRPTVSSDRVHRAAACVCNDGYASLPKAVACGLPSAASSSPTSRSFTEPRVRSAT